MFSDFEISEASTTPNTNYVYLWGPQDTQNNSRINPDLFLKSYAINLNMSKSWFLFLGKCGHRNIHKILFERLTMVSISPRERDMEMWLWVLYLPTKHWMIFESLKPTSLDTKNPTNKETKKPSHREYVLFALYGSPCLFDISLE